MEKVSLEMIIPIVAMIISWLFGWASKKWNWFESKYIPYQNAIVGMLSAVLYWILTPEANLVIVVITALSGLTAGGTYDLTKTNNNG